MPARTACVVVLGFPLILLLPMSLAQADDGKALPRGARPDAVSISGVSAGAAMAVQYAVAHSASVTGVGSIAGPPWGCADGLLSRSINACMCGRQPIGPTAELARRLAQEGAIDALESGRPRALKRAYVFQSSADQTVVKKSGDASVAFLREFVGPDTVVDPGNAADGSNVAQHGIISPDGPDQCAVESPSDTYIRKCGNEDNAGKLLLALLDPGSRYDVRHRKQTIAQGDIREFSQLPMIAAARNEAGDISPDLPFGVTSPRRAHFDMADDGFYYVPPVCRQPGQCGVHVALHGCKQDARQFAIHSGYNNWAQHYKLVIVYPAIKPDRSPLRGNICNVPWFRFAIDPRFEETNPNGCWDWWGYLEAGYPYDSAYFTRQAPQIRVIKRIIDAATAPAP